MIILINMPFMLQEKKAGQGKSRVTKKGSAVTKEEPLESALSVCYICNVIHRW